VFVVYELLNMR